MNRYLKDVFKIDDYISKGITKFFIISGVASGKSSWVKDVLSRKGSVLFVTSRKAKAEADKNNSSFTDVIKWNTNDNQTLITNAGLARRIEHYTVNGTQELDDFINHFDYIVIDEVHSIATDSLFADSCHTVLSFIEYVAELKKPIICMTGTPAPIQFYFEEKGWFILNFLKKCNYVHPSRVTMIMNHSVISEIKKGITNNKVIYFANRTSSIAKKAKELIEKGIVAPNELAISVSKSRETEYYEELRKIFKDDNVKGAIVKASEKAYASIINSKCLPDECKVLFSTSTLKEGIDIENENIVLFCENHDVSNLIQYFGRARKGKAKVFVIEDSVDYPIENDELLYLYANQEETEAANRFLNNEPRLHEQNFIEEEIYKLKNHVAKNPYIYYDVIKREFKTFHIKFHEKERIKSNIHWKQKIISHCSAHNIQLFYPKLDTLMKTILKDLAKNKFKLFGTSIESLKQIIYTAYRIDNSQPKKINEQLVQLKAPIRVYNGKETKGQNRDKKYWQILFVDDYEKLLSK